VRTKSHLCAAVAACALAAAATGVRAQDIEPRAYSNAPVGINFAIAGYAQTRGDPVERNVDGLIDPRFRVSVNFHGAPSLGLNEFRRYQQDLIVGASLQVGVPLGQYDPGRLINIGSNRWSFKPELGVSKAVGAWTLESKFAATIFTDNDNFFGGKYRSQEPIYSAQGNLIHSFSNGVWASLDATYYAGGRTTLDGVRGDDLQQNWRIGATLALPVDVRNSMKLYASSGVFARTGNNFDALGVAWQHRWGGGL
jgi:hypothetical protein